MGLTAVILVVLHMVDGRTVSVNPAQITRLAEARGEDNKNKQLHKDVRCVIHLADGNYVSVVEECDRVKEIIETTKP